MKKIKTWVAGFVVAFFMTVGLATAANAYTVRTTGWTTTCIGMDLWNVRIDYIDYSWWEEVNYPWPRDHYRYTATSMKQWHNSYCMSKSYA